MIALYPEYGLFGLVAAGLFGLLVGSFLSVLVHRLPRGESIISPASHCPACGAPVKNYDNIPVVSWILLKGRCRTCRAPIAVRYPALELSNAILWMLVFSRAREWPDFASGAFLASACLVLLAIDLEFQILPDRITLTGLFAGIALSLLSRARSPLCSLAGAAVGGGGLFLIGFLYQKVARQEGMGLGDVKMLGMIGAFLGPAGVLVTVLLASLAGSLVGLTLIALRSGDRKTRLPFGVFLAAGAIASFFFRDSLLERYRALWP